MPIQNLEPKLKNWTKKGEEVAAEDVEKTFTEVLITSSTTQIQLGPSNQRI
jgi:hypothetical protein